MNKRPAPGIAASLYQNFGVFRRGTDRQRPLPASVIAHWEAITGPPGFSASYGLDRAQAQHVNVAEREIWLVPGTAELAMLVPVGRSSKEPAYGTVSAPLDNVLAGRTVFWYMAPGDAHTVLGLVPDPNKLIRMEKADGSVIEVPVVNNMYAATTTIPFRVWQVRDASGKLRPVAKVHQDDEMRHAT